MQPFLIASKLSAILTYERVLLSISSILETSFTLLFYITNMYVFYILIWNSEMLRLFSILIPSLTSRKLLFLQIIGTIILFAGCGGKFFRGITYLEGTEKNWAAVWQHYLNPFTLVLLSLYVTTQSIYLSIKMYTFTKESRRLKRDPKKKFLKSIGLIVIFWILLMCSTVLFAAAQAINNAVVWSREHQFAGMMELIQDCLYVIETCLLVYVFESIVALKFESRQTGKSSKMLLVDHANVAILNAREQSDSVNASHLPHVSTLAVTEKMNLV